MRAAFDDMIAFAWSLFWGTSEIIDDFGFVLPKWAADR
jgi:hypothetical protein